MGVCHPVLQILTLFPTKNCHFPRPFSDLPLVTKPNITCLHKTQIMSSLLRFNLHKMISENPFRICLLHFPSDSFGIETANTLIYNRSFFVNHTRLQTKMGKIYTRFQTQNGAKTIPLGVPHTNMACIREYLSQGV